MALDPFASTMLLSTLYWPDEIRNVDELQLAKDQAEVKPAERAMAEQLVAAMTTAFDPAAYHDEYRQALLSIIEAKAAGAEIAEPPPTQAAGVTDLIAALEASVAAAKAARTASPPESITATAGARAATATAGARAARKAVAPTAIEPATEAVPARRRKSA